MTTIRLSPQAASDLEAIRDYLARDSERYAKLVVQRLVAAIELLATSPLMAPERRYPAIREVIVGAHRIVYRLRHDAVEIATIFHGARRFRDNDV